MKMLTRRKLNEPDFYTSDIARLKAALNRVGYDASDSDIRWAWEQHSESMAAGWLALCEKDEDMEQHDIKKLLFYLVEKE